MKKQNTLRGLSSPEAILVGREFTQECIAQSVHGLRVALDQHSQDFMMICLSMVDRQQSDGGIGSKFTATLQVLEYPRAWNGVSHTHRLANVPEALSVFCQLGNDHKLIALLEDHRPIVARFDADSVFQVSARPNGRHRFVDFRKLNNSYPNLPSGSRVLLVKGV